MSFGSTLSLSEKRKLWVKEKKNEEGEVTEKNGLERDVTKRDKSHGGSHSLLNFTKMPVKLNSQKLKTPISSFLFPSL